MELWKVGPILKKLVTGSMYIIKKHIYLDPATSSYPSLFPGHYEVSNSVLSERSICLTTGQKTIAVVHGLEPLKPRAKTNYSFLKLIFPGISHNHRKAHDLSPDRISKVIYMYIQA